MDASTIEVKMRAGTIRVLLGLSLRLAILFSFESMTVLAFETAISRFCKGLLVRTPIASDPPNPTQTTLPLG